MVEKKKGHLKIFFSYAENEGTVQSMLKEAWDVKEHGMSVAFGVPLAADSAETKRLAEGIDCFPAKQEEGRDVIDIDRILSGKPDLIIVENLASANGQNSRHKKRYQDVEEILNAGIHVYAAVYVGNIESLHDTVASITGTALWERIPDSVFDQANQVELLDVEPQELLEQLRREGTALTIEQLTALREIALRRYADRVTRLADELHKNEQYGAQEHILVCISSSPSNERIIRTAARMSRAFNSRFTALFVETPEFAAASEEDKQRLQENRKLAELLGAGIETVYGEDIPYQIAEFARLSGVTKIVLGRSPSKRRHLFRKTAFIEQLLTYVPEMDVHIIPDKEPYKRYRQRQAGRVSKKGIFLNIVTSIGILAGATLLSILFYSLGFTVSNIIMVYILGVLITSIATSHQLYSLVSSISSVFVFNFLFTEPRFSLSAYETGYPLTFLVMFLTAYITGTFAIRYKEQAGQSAKIAYRTKVLFDTDQLLSRAKDKNEIIAAAGEQIQKLLKRNIVIYENMGGTLSEPRLYYYEEAEHKEYEKETEILAARWVLENNHAAGANTDTMPGVHYYYLSIRLNERVYGVVGIEAWKSPLDTSEKSMLLAILGEVALALENERNAREKEETAILAEREQLRANLLRTISHDLRTPLTSISGNANNLLSNGDSFDEETKHQIYSDIYDDSLWLINLVENLLYATRIEDGRMTLTVIPELVTEIIAESMKHISKHASQHRISVECEDEFLLVRADARLMVQVIINLVNNAVKYTPPGSEISVKAERGDGVVRISVSDTGEGIPDSEKEKIFDKFYCGSRKIADNRRSLGLGLYLCRAIVEAHGGEIHVTDNEPKGSVFYFTLPLEDITIYEQ